MATLLAGGDARDAKGSAALDKGWHPDQPFHDGRRPGPGLVRQANDSDQQGPCLFDIAGALGALRPVRLPQGEVEDYLTWRSRRQHLRFPWCEVFFVVILRRASSRRISVCIDQGA